MMFLIAVYLRPVSIKGLPVMSTYADLILLQLTLVQIPLTIKEIMRRIVVLLLVV